MKHETISETKVAHSVLGLDDNDIASFVRRCMKDRSLSKLVSSLNDELLFGTTSERDDAKRALNRLGFL